MNRLQHLLCKLAEECNETAQMALKTAYFGLDEVYESDSNRMRLHAELDDLNALVEMLNEEFDFRYATDKISIEAKKAKVNRYARYSQGLGLLESEAAEVPR